MSFPAVKILGINITNSSKKEILEEIQKYLLQNPKSKIQNPKSAIKPLVIVTPNPEQIVYAEKNKRFADILNRADVAIPDGSGIVWASRFLGFKRMTNDGLRVTHSIPGVELMEDLVAIAAKRAVPIALIGGRGNLAVEAFECLQKRHHGLKGLAVPAPGMEVADSKLKIESYDNPEEYFPGLARTIVQEGAKIVFVGLGAPKQEYFIARLARECQMLLRKDSGRANAKCQIVMMSVGGSFDIITGRKPRAPAWVRRLRVPLFSGLIGSEFIWRLFHEPWRLGRQLALIKFIGLVLKERFF